MKASWPLSEIWLLNYYDSFKLLLNSAILNLREEWFQREKHCKCIKRGAMSRTAMSVKGKYQPILTLFFFPGTSGFLWLIFAYWGCTLGCTFSGSRYTAQQVLYNYIQGPDVVRKMGPRGRNQQLNESGYIHQLKSGKCSGLKGK